MNRSVCFVFPWLQMWHGVTRSSASGLTAIELRNLTAQARADDRPVSAWIRRRVLAKEDR
jgi:hypothetical protein